MRWFEVELEIPLYGKNFETVQAYDPEMAKSIAIRKTELEYKLPKESIIITNLKEINI